MELPPVDLERRLNFSQRAFFNVVLSRSQSDDPQVDPVIKAFNTAAVDAFRTIPAFHTLITDYVAHEKVRIPDYQVNKFFKAHQFVFMPDDIRNMTGFPQGFEDPQNWLNYLKENFRDPRNPLYVKVEDTLRTRPYQKNWAGRAKSGAIVAAMIAERNFSDNEPPRYIDLGCGAGNVMGALAMRTFGNATILDRDGTVNERQTGAFNAYTHMAPFGEAIGIDRQPPETEEDKTWHKTNTLDPRHLDRRQHPGYEDQYDLNAELQHSRITTMKGDMFNLDTLQPKDAAKLAEKKADIVTAMFVHGQQNPLKHLKFLKSMLKLLDPQKGALVVVDYARIDTANPQRLEQAHNWYDENFIVGVFALRAKDVLKGYVELMRWETSHCDTGIIQPGIRKFSSSFGQQ